MLKKCLTITKPLATVDQFTHKPARKTSILDNKLHETNFFGHGKMYQHEPINN